MVDISFSYLHDTFVMYNSLSTFNNLLDALYLHSSFSSYKVNSLKARTVPYTTPSNVGFLLVSTLILTAYICHPGYISEFDFYVKTQLPE